MADIISGLHECKLTRTNGGGCVFVCTCGEVGDVHPAPRHERPSGKRGKADFDAAAREAAIDWQRHFRKEHAALVPPDLMRAVPGLIRRGRFGTS